MAIAYSCGFKAHTDRLRSALRSQIRVGVLIAVTTCVCSDAAADVDFDRDVAPIFASHCLECHSSAEPAGDLSMTHANTAFKGGESGTAIVPGSVGSLLLQRVLENEMPPKHPLNQTDKDTLTSWIKQGAKWGTSPIDKFATTTSTRAGYDWWSLQPLNRPQPPASTTNALIRNPIDAFVSKKLAQSQLSFSAPADPRTLIRRLYFDLIGLPPTPKQVAAFVADPSDNAYDAVINELLSSKHYGERWARHWLDVVRFGESDGFERNNPRKNAWHYRDWVVKSFNNDLPYDEFVRMQLIGDQLHSGVEGAAATGFWVAGVHNTVVGGSKRMKLLARQDELEEVLATVGQTFLGLTINCARCHDHKFDPILQKEFYQMASAISGLGYGERQVKAVNEQQRLATLTVQIQQATEQLATIDKVARKEILAARASSKPDTSAAPTSPEPPAPIAQWQFDGNFKDSIGTLHGTARGNAHIEDSALVLDGSSFVETGPIATDIREKTLEAWIQLKQDSQRGGGAITIETRNGVVFDSIVFAERESKHWMAGSNGFARYQSFKGTEETTATQQAVHVAIVYAVDGTITAYRDGVAYGEPIRKAPLQTYTAGNSEIIFGLRHKPNGSGRNLSGRILKASLYDRALSADEVAASFGNPSGYVPEKQIVDSLSAQQRLKRDTLKQQIAKLTTQRNEQATLASHNMYTLKPSRGAATFVLLRGDPETPGEPVQPGGVGSIVGLNSDFGLANNAPDVDRRRRLAEWITNADNPLFSRVIVNRVWHYHFGAGIVDTPNDLGFNGGRASHPELLEWLAVQFRDSGMRLKDLHRLIVRSTTYRQSSGISKTNADSEPAKSDANNRLLWRMNPRRLESEALRDSMLLVSGKLNRNLGGPSFEDVSITSHKGTNYYEPIDVDGPQFFRRTIYRFNPRGGRSALLDTFDCPDPATSAPRRTVTTTPLQALSLLNNSFVLSMSGYFARRIEDEAGTNLDQQVRFAWQTALGREPTPEEHRLSKTLTQQHGLTALCRGLFNCSEFVIAD